MIVGTAGHIDHGKTALVKALTGTDTDRLAEEQARGISIDLGFAYAPLPSGQILGFVDVPGHERFMRNMLAGASGIDFVLLVVAADDGIMPQTREHLAVIEVLGVTRGAVALTKCDLADEARQAAVAEEVTALLFDGPLAGAPVFRCSARTGEGIDALRSAFEQAAVPATEPRPEGPLRFAIDRAFSLPGAGTVITGVLVSGALAVGDSLCISPLGREARVRALHVQGRPGERGERGQRCGVNLGKIDLHDVARGDFLLAPHLHAPTQRIDVLLRVLTDEPRPLRQWQPVRLHHAAAEVAAHVAVLEEAPVAPGATGRAQLVLDRPIAAAVGDRFVIRDHEGRRTIGGGRMIDLRPPQRRRKQPRRLEQLAAMALEDPAKSLSAQLAAWPWFVEQDGFARDRALGEPEMQLALAQVPHESVRHEGTTYLFGTASWSRLEQTARREVGQFHERYPQLLGPSIRRLMPAFDPRLPLEPLTAALSHMVARGQLVREGGVYRLPGHRLGLDRDDAALWRRIEALIGGPARFRPPRAGEIAQELRARDFECRRVLKAMSRQGRVAEIAPDHFFLRETLTEIAGIVMELARESDGGAFGAAQLRDRLDNGRKVAIQLLEYFDRQGLTLRRGDLRTVDARRFERYREGALGTAAA
ncbi:selenocysteine-specific translation elongation factor [Altererythrobacter soli]|uniref:Selenocysteine-specific elongation factor n=1 Tax=Croceibacterium soli TaxID=1739690 RepID=A0A6I4UST8_9SPHN|nr:selenocysteine-specific translation elongation factor [Croceibacterium soli]MXP40749.1 selenocysteine-specific translation elongation factor [Croceibacterium soli]